MEMSLIIGPCSLSGSWSSVLSVFGEGFGLLF